MLIPETAKTRVSPLPELIPAETVMDANESFIPMPAWMAAEIAMRLADTPLNRYPDPLSAKVCELAAAYYGVRPDQVTAGCGSDELISVIVAALIPPGGRLLLSEPDFGTYRFCAEMRELVCVAQTRQNGLPDLDALGREAKEGDCVILSNPCNPTGQAAGREEMLELVRKAPCLVVADEAYMDFWDQSLSGEIGRLENLILLRTASKTVGLAGIRLGFALTGAELTRCLRAAKLPYNVSALTQCVGEVVYAYPDLLRENASALFQSARKLYAALEPVVSGREGYRLTDTRANFVLLHAPDAKALYQGLLERGVRVRIMGNPPFLRITGGSERDNERFIAAVKEIGS